MTSPVVRSAFLALCVAVGVLCGHNAHAQPDCNTARIKDALARGDNLRKENDAQGAREQYELASKDIYKCVIDLDLAYRVYSALADISYTLGDYDATATNSLAAADVALRAFQARSTDELWLIRMAEPILDVLALQNSQVGPESMNVTLFDAVGRCILAGGADPELRPAWSKVEQRFRHLMGIAFSDILSRIVSHFDANKKEIGGSEGLEHLLMLNRRLLEFSRVADRVLPRAQGGLAGRRDNATVSTSAVQLARLLIAKGERSEPESLVTEALSSEPEHLHAKVTFAHLLAYKGQVDKALALHRLYRNREGWKVLVEVDLRLFESFGQAQAWFRQVRELVRR